jgi:serine phosphatase RsbU (regulator of sigma subunit)
MLPVSEIFTPPRCRVNRSAKGRCNKRTACEINRADLAAGDILVLYTDGITEAENSQGEEFGVERLSAVIRRDSSLSAEELMGNIFQSAEDFCQGVGFKDDATALVVKCSFAGN